VFESISTLTRYIQDRATLHAGRCATGSVAIPSDPLARLPHREPFRFISALTTVHEGESAEGVWDISGMEPFFAGHFPGRPIVPGVLIAEALAQISGIAGSSPVLADEGRLAQIDVRFEDSVIPPAQLALRAKLTRTMGNLQQFEVSAHAGSRCVARGSLTLARGGKS
jgi:3-hydroxyacyl-[acyl-carrier-protein] dehydratase